VLSPAKQLAAGLAGLVPEPEPALDEMLAHMDRISASKLDTVRATAPAPVHLRFSARMAWRMAWHGTA
jgi:hypothetical protein